MDNSFRKPRRREHLTTDEMEKLLVAAKTATRNPERDYAILLLLFRHGLRASELIGLKLSDVSLELRELHVRRVKGSDSGVHPFHNGESQAVAAWLAVREAMNVSAKVDTLFVSEQRKPFSRAMIWHLVRKVAEAADLGHLEIHPHMLRHSCGYSLVNRGIDIRGIQGYLGHRAISSTVRYTALDARRFAKFF
jgi:site-specific recombinase XerD